jgi:class 3 adenylate cyclase
MSSTRKLAAILFTDIVGYTALMGKDEQKAFELLRKNREILKPLIKQYHGTWIKELGDGILASFYTVTDAVFCTYNIGAAYALINKNAEAIHWLKITAEDGLPCYTFFANDPYLDNLRMMTHSDYYWIN